MPGTRKLGRTTAQRTAMLRAMVTFLLENGKIETTLTRAKEVQAMAEKMITTAKEDTLHNRRLVLAFVTKEDVTSKLFKEIAREFLRLFQNVGSFTTPTFIIEPKKFISRRTRYGAVLKLYEQLQ